MKNDNRNYSPRICEKLNSYESYLKSDFYKFRVPLDIHAKECFNNNVRELSELLIEEVDDEFIKQSRDFRPEILLKRYYLRGDVMKERMVSKYWTSLTDNHGEKLINVSLEINIMASLDFIYHKSHIGVRTITPLIEEYLGGNFLLNGDNQLDIDNLYLSGISIGDFYDLLNPNYKLRKNYDEMKSNFIEMVKTNDEIIDKSDYDTFDMIKMYENRELIIKLLSHNNSDYFLYKKCSENS